MEKTHADMLLTELSLFPTYSSRQPKPSTLGAVAALIREDADVRKVTEAYRASGRKELKRASTLFGVAARFSGGKRLADIVALTGLSMVDVDHVEAHLEDVRQRACADPHTLLCYRTVSGHGLRIIFGYELDASYPLDRQKQWYPKAFAAGNDYYERLLQLPTDRQCKNVGRLSGLAHDALVFCNPQATPFTQAEIEAAWQAQQGARNAKQRRQRELVRIRRAYEQTIQPEVLAQGAVYAPGSHNDYVMRVGYRLNQMGFHLQAALQWAEAQFADYADTQQVITACYQRTDEHGLRAAARRQDRSQEADVATRVEQMAQFLAQRQLRYDRLSRKIQMLSTEQPSAPVWQELTERDVNDLFIECCSTLTQNLHYQDFRHVLNSSVVAEINPLRYYIEHLPAWDGTTDYIGQAAAMVTTTTQPLWQNCFRKWFCAMVASWMQDEVVNHQVLVLIGQQGIYKTTWLDALMPPQLAAYRCRQSGARALDKDEQLRATEFGLINMDEIDRMSESELNALKSLITASDINVRAAYAQAKERRLRVASYVASGNKEQFLTDTTGNRRWLPFHVQAIESPFDHPLPYEGMYAQAWALVGQGFNYWFSLDDIGAVASHVETFAVQSSEEQLLPVYFEPCQVGTNGAVFLTGAEISAKLTLYGNLRRPMNLSQLGALLKRMNYVRARAGRNGKRGYIVLEKSAEAINAQRRLDAMKAAAQQPLEHPEQPGQTESDQ